MSNSSRAGLGGALDSALDGVLRAPSPNLSVADAGTAAAFLSAWSRTLSEHARYLRSQGRVLSAPVIVAYVSDLGAFSSQHGWARHSMLGASTEREFAGMVIAATGEVAGCIHSERVANTDDCEMRIADATLGGTPTIALISPTKLLVWPDGLDGSSAPLERDLSDATIVFDLAMIRAELEHFYKLHARQTQKWWKDRELRTTVENPEAAVQNDLHLFLLARNSEAAWIRAEEVVGNGRADLTITPRQPFAVGQTAVLELKTLRDVRTPRKPGSTPIKVSPKKNWAWACKGIQQAAAYREHHGMNLAMLCLYDFCAANSSAVSDAVEPYAIRYDVSHNRYWITNSNAEHRDEIFPVVAS